MLNKLISLVFLLFFLNINVVYSETNFLLPQKKPSIFKMSDNQIKKTIENNLPVPKPKIKDEEKVEKEQNSQAKNDKPGFHESAPKTGQS